MLGWCTAGSHGQPIRVTPYQARGPFIEYPVKADSYTPPISQNENVNFDIEICDGKMLAVNVTGTGTQWNGSYGSPS